MSLGAKLPIRPLRLVGGFLAAAAVRVPVYAGLAAGALLLAANVLGRGMGNSVLASIGSWSITAILVVAGVIGGGIAGLLAAAERSLRGAETELRTWFEQLPRNDGDRLLPSAPLASFRNGYDAILDRMFDQTVGRLPMPPFARRLARSRFHQAVFGDFLEHCERTGASVVGFSEVRDYLVSRGLPIITAPAHAQLRLWTTLVFGLLGAFFVIPLLIGLLAGSVAPVHVATGTFAMLGLAVAVLGLMRAQRSAAPARHRTGVLTIGAGLAAWPILYVQLWRYDLGMVWIVVLAATAWTFHWGVRQMIRQPEVVPDRASAA